MTSAPAAPPALGTPLAPAAVLSIAGSDPSGGAGIQADIKTISALGLYAAAVPAVLTAQNTRGVRSVQTLDPGFVEQQIAAVLEDIRPAAVKIGMLGNAETVRAVAHALDRDRVRAAARGEKPLPIVLDPVMVSSSGTRLLSKDAVRALEDELAPLCTLITPNIPEAETFIRGSITSRKPREAAASILCEAFECAVLIKGGHASEADNAADCLARPENGTPRITWFEQARVPGAQAHGTGCALSSAIACGLARGLGLEESIRMAKDYLAGALAHPLCLGQGTNPVNHFWRYR